MIAYILTLILTVPWILILGVIAYYGLLNALYIYGYASPFFLPPAVPPTIAGIPLIGPFIAFLVFNLTPSYIAYLGLGGGGLLILLIFLLIIYLTTVRNINRGRYERARNASLFWGVLFLIPAFFVIFSPTLLSGTIVGILPAFFFLLAWGRLSEVIAKYGPVAVLGEAVPGAPFAGPPAPPPCPPGMPMPMGGPMPGPMGAPMPGPMGPVPGGPMPAGLPMSGGPMPMQQPQQPAGPSSRIPLCPTCGKELYYSANHRRWYCQNCDNPGNR